MNAWTDEQNITPTLATQWFYHRISMHIHGVGVGVGEEGHCMDIYTLMGIRLTSILNMHSSGRELLIGRATWDYVMKLGSTVTYSLAMNLQGY